jgi:hypothetical protein|tara:strand:+ start:4663 stop:4950 length:288 start_codon:yes stop_codon:yes gene_type:complete
MVKKHIKRAASYTKGKADFLHNQFRDHASTAIIAALGFIIALAWKDLIVKIVENFTRADMLEKYPYIQELYVAIVVTVVAITGIALIGKWAKKVD